MIDMHIHTKNSDGENNVYEIIEMLKEENIKFFSITDHDNIDSCYEMEKIILPSDFKYISGVEFSSKLNNYHCHILGYNFDYKNIDMINEYKKIKRKRYERMLTIIDNLYNNFGIIITEEEKKSILNKQGSFGRPDLCKILLNRGYGTRSEIFDKYLIPPIGFNHRSDVSDIVNIIHGAGGVAVVAHPKEIENDYNVDFENIIKYFLELGIDGIEVYNSIHELKDVKKYMLLALKYHLLTTGGSDYHGSMKPNVSVGYTTKEKIKIFSNDINFRFF